MTRQLLFVQGAGEHVHDEWDARLGAIILIAAPFAGEGGWPAEGWVPRPALGEALPRGVPVHVFHGLADAAVPPSHADLYARAIPRALIHRLPERDHQLGDDLREVAAVIGAPGDGF